MQHNAFVWIAIYCGSFKNKRYIHRDKWMLHICLYVTRIKSNRIIFNEQYSESVLSTCFISWPRTRNVIATQKWHTREKGRILHSVTNGNMVKLTLISIYYLHLFTYIYFPFMLPYLQCHAFWLLVHLITFDYNMFTRG